MEIVLQSGNIVREHWARPSNVMHKGRIDLVTQTDLAVEAFLKEKLAGLVPGAAFMAEESSQSEREPDGLCWIIDPVDGTTNFVHRIPQRLLRLICIFVTIDIIIRHHRTNAAHKVGKGGDR